MWKKLEIREGDHDHPALEDICKFLEADEDSLESTTEFIATRSREMVRFMADEDWIMYASMSVDGFSVIEEVALHKYSGADPFTAYIRKIV